MMSALVSVDERRVHPEAGAVARPLAVASVASRSNAAMNSGRQSG